MSVVYMGQNKYRDTCGWCSHGTNKIQIRSGKSFGLCPSCCPDITVSELPDVTHLPPTWYNMTSDEREEWLEDH